MRRALFLLTLVAAMVFACAGVVLAQARAPDTSQLDRYIVVLKEDADPEQGADKAQREHGASIRHVYDGEALNGYAAVIPGGRLAALSRDPDVAFIDKDTLVYADVSTGGATGVDRIDGEPNDSPDGSYVSDGSGAKVAVLDTGIDLDHPDLNAVNGINTISTTGTIYSDCSRGRENTGPTSADDDQGHGTHVAGTIGAKNNGNGVVGVAPGAELYAVKVLNAQGSGYVSDIICGMNWVTSKNTDTKPDGTLNEANDIDTANMSLGGTGSDDGQNCAATTIAYKKAICNSVGEGVTYVVSAGNDGADLATKRPASYRDGTKPLVLTVTAVSDYDGKPGGLKGTVSDTSTYCRTGTDDTPASFSNYATTTVDRDHTIAAPGVCIRSTAPGGGTTTKSGTSMAAPHVTGTVALCLRSGGSCSSSGATTPGQIIDRLRGDAEDQPTSYWWSGAPGTSKYYGYLEYAGDYRSGAGPDTTISSTSGPSEGSKTTKTSASFTYSSSEPNATFECSLDGTAFSSCPTTDPMYTGLGDGQHAFEVRAKDAAGTVDPTPAKRTWTVDTTAPTVSNPTPADGADNVALNDNVTITFSEDMEATTLTDPSTPTFTLKAPDGSLVSATVSYDAATKKATLDPATSLKPTTIYTATVTTGAKDKAGNALLSNKDWSFQTVSESAPTAPSNLTANRGGSGSNQKINLTWTDNSNNETKFTVERSRDSSFSTIEKTVELGANTTSYTDSPLSRGTTYYYRVKATNGTVHSAYSNTASAKTK